MASEKRDADVFAELAARLAPFQRVLPTVAELRAKLTRIGARALAERVDEAFGDADKTAAIDTEGEES